MDDRYLHLIIVLVVCLLAATAPVTALTPGPGAHSRRAAGADTTAVGGAESPTIEMTIREIAHGYGLKGGDLAESLGLPRAVDKTVPLRDLGVDAGTLSRVMSAATGTAAPLPVGHVSRSLAEIAATYGIPAAALAHDLGISTDTDTSVPVQDLGITQAALDEALEHAAHDSEAIQYLKYPLFAAFCVWGLVFLLRAGRGRDPRRRKRWYPQRLIVMTLALAVVLLGFAIGKSPNPMESVVKVFKAGAGLYLSVWPKLAWLGFFGVLGVIGNKVICGWACPFGAVQELLYMVPVFRKLKKRKLPFRLANTVRGILFLLFVLLIFGVIGSRKGFVLYHYINPFNLFGLEFAHWLIATATAVYLAAALLSYRPFCQFICPFGLISWVLERISFARIRIDRKACTDCRACARICPLDAARDRLDGKRLPADCFSCARCLRVCPDNAIHYGVRIPASIQAESQADPDTPAS